MIRDYSIEIHEIFVKGPVVVMLGVAQGSFAVDGKLIIEERWSTPASFRAFIEEGKVTEWRVFADNEPVHECVRKHKQSGKAPAGGAA